VDVYGLLISCKPLTVFLHKDGVAKFANQTEPMKFVSSEL